MDLQKKELAAPTELTAFDTPSDGGGSVTLKWKASPTENTPEFLVKEAIDLHEWDSGLTVEKIEKEKLEEKRRYAAEPKLVYNIYMSKGYPVFGKVFASMNAGSVSGVSGKWKETLYNLKKAPSAQLKAAVAEIKRLMKNIRPEGDPDPALSGLLAGFAGVLDSLAPIHEKKEKAESLIKKFDEYEKDPKKKPKPDLKGKTPTEIKNELERTKEKIKGIVVKLDQAAAPVNKELETITKNENARQKILDALLENTEWTLAGSFPSGVNYCSENPAMFGHGKINEKYHYFLAKGMPDSLTCRFRVELVMGDKKVAAEPGVIYAASAWNWFDFTKLNIFIVMLVFSAIVLLFIQLARKNPNMFIRKIGGLDAVDEAIGRATEMGKPIFFIPGIGTMGDLPTIASINILGRVARRAAKYDTVVKVPCYDPVVMTVAQEVIKEAYQSEGRLDAYSEDNVFFITQDQFSYAAAVDGMMVREKPATNFLMGLFFAESLLLSETGASIGAIQISGTDALAQLPFFITTTDYTLIGEELYAASAYLSRDPLLLGSLRGQDVGKAALLIVIILGTVIGTVGFKFISWFFV